jgi:Rrf2 family protein
VRILLALVRLSDGVRLTRKEDVARREGIPVDYVEQILLTLRRTGLVTSRRGARGGFQPARDAAAVTVADIVEAVEGPIMLAQCLEGGKRCARASHCATREVWQGASRLLTDYLGGITLADLVRKAEAAEAAETTDFEI